MTTEPDVSPEEPKADNGEETLPIPTPENPWRSAGWVAEAVGVKQYTVSEWCRTERIKAYKVFGEWKILHSDYVAFCQQNWGNGNG